MIAAPRVMMGVGVIVVLLTSLPRAAPLSAQVDAAFAGLVAEAARQWDGGRPDSLVVMGDSGGLRVTLPSGDLGLLDRRQAAAALASFFEPLTGQGVELRERRVMGGTPPTAFAELTWSAFETGIPDLRTYTVYLGFRRAEGSSWRLTELRVLR